MSIPLGFGPRSLRRWRSEYAVTPVLKSSRSGRREGACSHDPTDASNFDRTYPQIYTHLF